MKGMSNNILAAFLIVIIMAVLLPSISISFIGIGDSQEYQVKVKKDIYTMDNALDAAKIYSENAFHYSVYQSCYDVLRMEGPLPNETIFFEEMGDDIKSNMKKYTKDGYSFLDGYKVNFPVYEINVSKQGIETIVSASSGQNMYIEKESEEEGESVKLEKDPLLSFELPCYDIYNDAWQRHETIPSDVSQTITDEINKSEWKKNIQGQASSCEDVFSAEMDKTIPEAEEEINETIKNSVSGILGSGEEYVSSDVEITGKMLSQIQTQDGTITLNCDFIYHANITVRVNITGSDTLPVYNGTDIVFAPLGVIFLDQVNVTAP